MVTCVPSDENGKPQCLITLGLPSQHTIMLHGERCSCLDQTCAALNDIPSVLGDRQVVHELTGKIIASPHNHIGTVQSYAKA
jgi:hypothetical protein